jgi:hypothetical protein
MFETPNDYLDLAIGGGWTISKGDGVALATPQLGWVANYPLIFILFYFIFLI